MRNSEFSSGNVPVPSSLLKEVRSLITESHARVVATVNSAMSILYWEIGQRINTDILQNQRAGYGQEVVASLAKALSLEFGKGWSEKQLRHCLRTAETFQNKEIFYALSRELSWTHIRAVIYMEDDLKRSFYLEMCRIEKWSTRTFQERINSMLYERTAISKKPEQTIQNEIKALEANKQLTDNLVFRDPYLLEFLGLQDTYSEKDLESAILVELQKFIIELGSDFAFMARQQRITIDNEDYYLDLLFYHRRLKCLVAIELKLGKFEAAHKGQMELYLRWLEKHEQVEGENPPIGLILCSSKNEEHIELLQLENSKIKVAEYLTQLPDMKVLETKLNQAIERAKNKMNLDEQ